MSSRNRGHADTSETPGSRPAERTLSPEDVKLNDDIHALLREAADRRDERTREQKAADVESARRSLESIMTLSRARQGPTKR